MAIAMLLDNPGGSREIYDQLRKRLDLERPVGGILHVAGPSPNGGWRIIELFDSQEDASRFLKERFAPIYREVAGSRQPPDPQFWPVHNYLT
jgi:hypothetical protein